MQGEIFTQSFSTQQNGRIGILKATLLAGYDLKKGSLLRFEESDTSTFLDASKQVNLHFKNTQRMILKAFITVCISAAIVSFPQNVIGFGPDADPYKNYTSFFHQHLPQANGNTAHFIIRV